jgi:hypothetical protein
LCPIRLLGGGGESGTLARERCRDVGGLFILRGSQIEQVQGRIRTFDASRGLGVEFDRFDDVGPMAEHPAAALVLSVDGP